MDQETDNVTFAQIGHGELEAQTNAAIVEVIQSLRDLNLKAGSKREVNVKIVFAANERRTSAKMAYSVTTKLGSREPGEMPIHMAGEGKNVKSSVVPLNQPRLMFLDDGADAS